MEESSQMKQLLRKRILILLTVVIYLATGIPSYAANEESATSSGGDGVIGGAEPSFEGKSGTQVYVGVLVDYMGKLKFCVRDRDTKKPIEGASVELFVKGMDRYIFFGLTDKTGCYELDVAYSKQDDNIEDQYEEKNGRITFKGNMALFQDNQILYKVYKQSYLPYPETGEVYLSSIKLPHQVDVYLYRERAETLPKTGVERAVTFWVVGLVLCVGATGFFLLLLRRMKKSHEKEVIQ